MAREDTTASVVLELRADGSATACRGWRHFLTHDGPERHEPEHVREQLGDCGAWEQHDRWLRVGLRADDAECVRVGEYTHLVPDHVAAWDPTCLALEAGGHSGLTGTLLACRPTWPDPRFGEDEPHLVPGLVPGNWIVLGEGNGLRARIHRSGDAPADHDDEGDDEAPLWRSATRRTPCSGTPGSAPSEGRGPNRAPAAAGRLRAGASGRSGSPAGTQWSPARTRRTRLVAVLRPGASVTGAVAG